jgi:hypothetical protein
MVTKELACRAAYLALICMMAEIETVSASEQEAEPRVSYQFAQDLAPYVGVLRHGKVWLGHLDAAGNFLPEPRVAPLDPGAPFSGPQYVVINKPTRPNEPVYEYRSATLIRGVLDNEGNFIPEIGTKVISIKEFQYGPNALRIYNLPGKFVKKSVDGTDKE